MSTASSDIIRIATTVGLVQLVCSFVANRYYFTKDEYLRAVEAVHRCKWNLQREQELLRHASNSSNVSIHETKIVKYQETLRKANATLGAYFVFPNVITAIIFMILLRILAAEFGGRIVAFLPFAPFTLLHRLTGRGLEFAEISVNGLFGNNDDSLVALYDIRQAASYMFVYVLCNLSVKVYVNQLFGTAAPPGAEGALMEQAMRNYEKSVMKKME
ncbi:hypothetical protein MPSEU_001104000 [Mayamaea pseudoterrestris]|nr:hypothetical protein MPSEU_001104000 [Mayamaea pseudoterrestris]